MDDGTKEEKEAEICDGERKKNCMGGAKCDIFSEREKDPEILVLLGLSRGQKLTLSLSSIFQERLIFSLLQSTFLPRLFTTWRKKQSKSPIR